MNGRYISGMVIVIYKRDLILS